ncbi:hypothetical protein [Pseudomonas bubulae]|uniref:hypothetical protein n=1 Tax=Pseudomonas bubulae TaxID=2316085 RepID=UPI00399C8201
MGECRLCSQDVDDAQWARHLLRELIELNLDGIADEFPCVTGNSMRIRVLFPAPENSTLQRYALTWTRGRQPLGDRAIAPCPSPLRQVAPR